MNNEPVAWMSNGKEFYVQKNHCPDFIPLYTHLADESFDRTASHMAGEYVSYPAKTLTDEEIQLLIKDVPNYDIDTHDLMEFAKAILRKAQEK
jgi:hypothetical protein